MSLSQIKNAVDALRRKFALPLVLIRTGRECVDIPNQWRADRGRHKQMPSSFAIVQEGEDSGYRNGQAIGLRDYIERSIEGNECPVIPRIPAASVPPALKILPM